MWSVGGVVHIGLAMRMLGLVSRGKGDGWL